MVDDRDPPPGGSKLVRDAGCVPEPGERDAEGKPVQPEDRPPARPHRTVTHEPEPSPHAVKDEMDEGG